MSSLNAATYADCVASLRTSLSFLESSVNTLDAGVSDFPRLVKVLKTVRHYELVPQPTLAQAEASLRDEIGPFIAILLDRADRQVERQERRIETLKARSELQQGRLSHAPGESDDEGTKSRGKFGAKKALGGATKTKLDADAKLKARAVRQRKEALKYAVERLELEVVQKERELRKRLEKA